MTNYSETPEFKRDFKRLQKKYRTLPSDLDFFKELLEKDGLNFDNKNATILSEDNACRVVKARFFCMSLKKDFLRVICVIVQKQDEIIFIELYYKGDKSREDERRLKKYKSKTDK